MGYIHPHPTSHTSPNTTTNPAPTSTQLQNTGPNAEPAPETLPPPFAGSLMIFRAVDLEKAWERIKSDVYWTEGVWEKEECRVNEFIKHGMYRD
jgi:uncharacterized protein YciI